MKSYPCKHLIIKGPTLFFGLFLILLSACDNSEDGMDNPLEMIYTSEYKTMFPISQENFSRKIMVSIFEMAKSGQYKLYVDEDKTAELSQQEFSKLFEGEKDTLYQVSPDGLRQDTFIYDRQLKPSDIASIRFIEEWEVDQAKGTFKKRVIGVGPGIEYYDEEGNFLGPYRVFWLFFDDKT